MSHPRIFFCSASCTSPASFLKDSVSSLFRSYYSCSGWKSVWMTNRAALSARSIQCSSSTVIVMILLRNPSIDASVDVMYTAKGCAVARCLAYFCFPPCGSKDWCGEFRSYVSQDSYRSRSLPRSISDSLTVIYSASEGVVPKFNLRQRKASSSIIAMHVNAVVVFACIQR